MHLAIFDLDNTLLAGDSDYLWGQFLVEQGLVDAATHGKENKRFYDEYHAGTLDINAFAAFSLAPLVRHGASHLAQLRPKFVAEVIQPIIATGALPLLERHRAQGDRLLIMTATSRFITEPIAELLGVDQLIATDPEIVAGQYTGRIEGIPNFKDGKVRRLQQWRAQQSQTFDSTTFYSDSHNDLPLLRIADHPVAVDPDETLRIEAERCGWPVISLRAGSLKTSHE
jgi:HAD superfamily hydrolase (TIGR01490 family)